MSIKLMPDVGAPLAVTAINLVVKTVQPGWDEWAKYIIAGGGYALAMMNWGGDFVKNMAIAELPSAAEKLYDRVVATPVTSQRLAFRGVSRYPAPAEQSPFDGVKLT